MPFPRYCFAPSRRLRLGAAMLIASGAAWTGLKAGDATGSLQSIAEREVQRRQQLVNDAESQLSEAMLINSKGQHAEAADKLKKIYDLLPDSPVAAGIRARVRAAYAQAACDEAQSLLGQARYKEAHEFLDSVLDDDVDPKNARALTLKKHADDPDRYPPALTPEHLENTKKVQALLLKAGSAIDLGDYDLAYKTYSDALRIDPYNVAARRGMERAEQHRSEYFDAARDHTRGKMLTEVSKQWADPVPLTADLTSLFNNNAAIDAPQMTGREKIAKKLRSIKLPRVDFNGTTLEEVLEYLRVSSRSNDPENRGVSFVLNVEPELKSRTFTLSLQDVPLEEVVRYVAEMSGTATRVEDTAVVFYSMSMKLTDLITKKYRVPPDFIQSSPVDAAPAQNDPFAPKGAATATAPRRMGAKEFLENRGVKFPDGGGASFSAGTSTLIVRANADALNLVDVLVEQAQGAIQKQVKVEVKMVEMTQEAYHEIGTDVGLGQANVPGSNRVFMGGGTPLAASNVEGDRAAQFSSLSAPGANPPPLMTTGLRSAGPIVGAPGIDQLLRATGSTPSIDSVSSSQFLLQGVFSDPQFGVALRALSNTKGVDLVTVPSVVTKSGQKASIHVVREFPYPTEFDPPQIPQTVSSGSTRGSIPVTPTTPTTFEKKEVGVILDVEPNISADGRTVEVSVTPSITEFEGFINYGSPIQTTQAVGPGGIGGSKQITLTDNQILQPVFRKHGTNTSVNIYDGSTIIIAGLIDERATDIRDKVPFLGDIPLVGRLWQSKVKQSNKRCVVFYVTVTVIDPSGQRVNQNLSAAAQ